jgi:hypothetical protein
MNASRLLNDPQDAETRTMGQGLIQLPWRKGEAKQVGYLSDDVEAKADKQRRKIQNRKNQRAHRESVLRYHSPLPSLCSQNLCRTAA